MSINQIIEQLLRSELLYQTNLSEDATERVIKGFVDRLSTNRFTLTTSYLTDDMFEAQQGVDSTVDFANANAMFIAAIAAFGKQYKVEDKKYDDFW